MAHNAKYNEVGAGAKPRLGNTSMLYNGPARPASGKGAGQSAHKREEAAGSGVMEGGNQKSPRQTPKNQHGLGGHVEPSAKQPSGAVKG
tara:strand:- start:2015 stop:2281 length:267 start_codon:yes stop_codon:yes gene_type:complete